MLEEELVRVEELYTEIELMEKSADDDCVPLSQGSHLNTVSISSNESLFETEEAYGNEEIYDTTPLEIKEVVEIARRHPKWSINTLKKHGSWFLQSKKYLRRWKPDVERGGTHGDFKAIHAFVYSQFKEARAHFQTVTSRTLQEWAMCAAQQLAGIINFSASHSWLVQFNETTPYTTTEGNEICLFSLRRKRYLWMKFCTLQTYSKMKSYL